MAYRSKKLAFSITFAHIRKVIGISAVIALIAFLVTKPLISRHNSDQSPISIITALTETFEEELKVVEPITLLFAGDVMMDRGVRRSIEKNFAHDYGALFKNTEYVRDTDIAFLNLEGPVATGGKRVGSIYTFRMEPESLIAMKEAGFDMVSFANNHVGDYAQAAFDETMRLLEQYGMQYTGAGRNYTDATAPRIVDVRGMKIGFLSTTDVGPNWMKATTTRPGILLASDPNLSNIISEAKNAVDILVVSFHFGEEYSPVSTRQKTLAHNAIDSGADIIVGHHAHVMQATETYNGKLIFYGLGNYIFDQYFSPHTMRGMMAKVTIDPTTKEMTHELFVSPLSRQFIPQALIPFDESMLVKKTFTP